MRTVIIEEFPRYSINENGDVRNTEIDLLLKPYKYNKQMAFRLHKKYHRTQHELLCKAFLPNPFNHPNIRHRDGDVFNNKLSNLEWCNIYEENVIKIVTNGDYEVVKEYSGYAINKEGVVVSLTSGDILTPSVNKKNGYVYIGLFHSKNGEKKKLYNVRIHRLLMIQFVDNPESYPVINHLDFNRANNSLDNLEWCSQVHNLRHSRDNGRCPVTDGLRASAARNGHMKSKWIINIETGVYYFGIREAMKSLPYKINYYTLATRLNGRTPNDTPLRYAYLT